MAASNQALPTLAREKCILCCTNRPLLPCLALRLALRSYLALPGLGRLASQTSHRAVLHTRFSLIKVHVVHVQGPTRLAPRVGRLVVVVVLRGGGWTGLGLPVADRCWVGDGSCRSGSAARGDRLSTGVSLVNSGLVVVSALAVAATGLCGVWLLT